MLDGPPRRWNETLIKSTFTEPEAQAIMSIPISWSSMPDKLTWRWCQDGLFTVKSMYKQLQLQSLTSEAGSSVSYPWKEIWKLQVPGKIKHFLYRAVNNTLPCKRNLIRRGITMHDGCLSCQEMSPESLDHVFLQCSWVQRFWFAALGFRSLAVPSFRGWISSMLAAGDTELVQYVAVLAWAIWKRRNNLLFNGSGAEVPELMCMANDLLKDWTEANTVTPREQDASSSSE